MTKTTKEMIEVMQAFEDGKPIECMNYNFGVWELCDDPLWDWLNTDYRIAVTKPSIDWSQVSKEFNFLARNSADYNHKGLLMSAPPYQGTSWVPQEGRVARANVFASYDPGTCDWQDSLVVRPGHTGCNRRDTC